MSLPSLGRSGIVNSVRKLSGYDVPGYRDVDSTCEFIAGQVATLAANSTTGNPELTLLTGTAYPIGIFFCHKATNFYEVVRYELVTVPAIGANATLKHANLKNLSYRALPAITISRWKNVRWLPTKNWKGLLPKG